MGGRKQKKRELKPGVYIIGEGITEQYYFSHIKRILGFHYSIKPRFFKNTSIAEMGKKIRELLRFDLTVICVFDTDVCVRDQNERERLEKLQSKYKNANNLLFCSSFPSIEFWFLLHYLETNRHFQNTKEVELKLKKHIKNYEKTTTFLKNEKWVVNLCDNLQLAMGRAKKVSKNSGSYSNIYKAFDLLFQN